MSSEAARRAPSIMTLRELVDRYLGLAGEFGKPVALSAFGLAPDETERLFGVYDEDYHISRFFHFSEASGERYSIGGALASHVAIDAGIRTIL